MPSGNFHHAIVLPCVSNGVYVSRFLSRLLPSHACIPTECRSRDSPNLRSQSFGLAQQVCSNTRTAKSKLSTRRGVYWRNSKLKIEILRRTQTARHKQRAILGGRANGYNVLRPTLSRRTLRAFSEESRYSQPRFERKGLQTTGSKQEKIQDYVPNMFFPPFVLPPPPTSVRIRQKRHSSIHGLLAENARKKIARLALVQRALKSFCALSKDPIGRVQAPPTGVSIAAPPLPERSTPLALETENTPLKY